MSISIITEGFVASSAAVAGVVTISAVSPTPNTAPGAAGGMPSLYADAKLTPIVLHLTDSAGDANLSLVSISAVFLNGQVETVYRLSNFVGNYINKSVRTPITNGRELQILRDGGWPGAVGVSNLAIGLIIDIADAGGTNASTAYYYQMPLAVPAAITPTVVQAGADDLVEHGLNRLIWQLRS